MSSKQLTTFSDHRLPLSHPDHISLPQYVEYLKSYIKRFDLESHIKLACPVTSIAPLEKRSSHDLRHEVRYRDLSQGGAEQTMRFSHIAICTGLHVQPNVPIIPGIENFKGEAYHSSEYKLRSQLTGRDVLILGCGETAMGALPYRTCTQHR